MKKAYGKEQTVEDAKSRDNMKIVAVPVSNKTDTMSVVNGTTVSLSLFNVTDC